MTDQELSRLLRSALPPVGERSPGRGGWPDVVAFRPPPPDWSWLDVTAALAAVLLLVLFPDSLWLLLMHL